MENGARNSSKPPCRILALVEFRTPRVGYLRRPFSANRISVSPGNPKGVTKRIFPGPFQHEPDFGVTSVNYDVAELIARSRPPQ